MHQNSALLLLLAVVSVVSGTLERSSQLGRRVQSQKAVLKGDFILGALFSVHHQPKQKRAANSLSCGRIRETYGIQRIEVTFHTLDKINKDPTILPNITLGVEIRDSCWYAPVALQQSLEFIRDAISPQTSVSCSSPQVSGSNGSTKSDAEPKSGPLIGVIGPGSSSAALQVQNLLQLFQIPQIGYSTTSRDLSDKGRFNYFLRVVPPDYYQAQVMLDILLHYNWTYVSAVNTDENYGQSGMQAFRSLAETANVCIAKEDTVLSNADDEEFDKIIIKLSKDVNARVVVCFCEGMTVRGLLAAIGRKNLTGRFVLLGSDGWADRSDVIKGYEEQAKGSLSVRIHSPYVSSFDDYYFSLDPFNNSRNPWFQEFWQDKFSCIIPSDDTNINKDINGIINIDNKTLTTKHIDEITHNLKNSSSEPPRRLCTGKENLSDRYEQDPKLSFVIKSIYTAAYGLHNLHQDICGKNTIGVCSEMFPVDGSLFKNYLLNVSFTYGEGDGEIVEFDKNGDPPGRYNIMNFQLLSNGSYNYVHVGDWNNGTLTLRETIQLGQTPGVTVESVCSRPCPQGHFKKMQEGGQEKKCCWMCMACKDNEILTDEETCTECEMGFWPNENKTECLRIPVEFVKWTDTEAVVSIVSSCVGFIMTGLTAAVFIRYNDTPVVKSSTRELSYLILAGMTLSHSATFPILARPSELSCSLSRVLPGLSFAMIYASLLTKTNRIARILAGSKKRFPTRKPRFMSGTAQVVITCILIGIEAGVAGGMLLLEPAGPEFQYPSEQRVLLVCNSTRQAILAPLAFDFLLIALCTLYALKTRNVPENFNEAKFIGFAMYTTCVIWIAFVPIYFGSDSKIITMCMCVTLSAMVTLVFLFFPKLYIILLRPERNNRAHFTTSKEIRCHIGTKVGLGPKSNSYPSTNDTSSFRDGNCPSTINAQPGMRNNRSSPFDMNKTVVNCNNNFNVNINNKCNKNVPRLQPTTIHQRTLSVQTDIELLETFIESIGTTLGGVGVITTSSGVNSRNKNCIDYIRNRI
ncbi:metabotropic glutamate receptor 1-like [Lycorma delicatula]|uniref:metabotropic glutamate receptor 1-like n=1 Tax=Lycorma delicatula TaxID=130591 RepID=UPI003F51494D